MESSKKTFIMDHISGFFKSWQGLVNNPFIMLSDPSQQNQIEKLKSMQQETSSDLMKLKERHDTMESMLSLNNYSKGIPLKQNNTQIKGNIGVVGLVFAGDNVRKSCDFLDQSGIRSGIHSKIIFETSVREKDTLVAEFITSDKYPLVLALATLMYSANIKDGLSVTLAPLGAQPIDFSSQGSPPSLPPLLNDAHEYAAGISIKGSKMAASLAQLVSGLQTQNYAASTYAQVSYHPFEEMKVNLSGVWRMPVSATGLIRLGTFGIPLTSLKQQTGSNALAQPSLVSSSRASADSSSSGPVALMFDTEYDEITKLAGWMELHASDSLNWGMSLSETPEDEIGWGLKLGGKYKGQLNQFQLEAHLNLPLSKNLNFQPGIAYATEGRTGTPALLLQSSWVL